MTLPKQNLPKQASRVSAKTTPPLLWGLAGLLAAVAFACFLGLTAFQNEKATRDAVSSLQTSWDERAKSYAASPNATEQDVREIDIQQDRLKLAQITDGYRQIFQLVSISAALLVLFSLACFVAFRFGFLLPLRKLEQSSRDLIDSDLKGHIWGLDRNDAFGSLARSIADIRNGTVGLADMVVQTENGEQHVRFEGRSAEVFTSLIADLQKTVEQLTSHSASLETVTKDGQESIQSLAEVTAQQAQNLEESISESRAQMATTHDEWGNKLSTLFHQNQQIQGQSKQLVEQFTRDMQSLNHIAGATGGRIAQTLQLLSTTDRDIKKAAQQSLESSSRFTAQANDLTEKLQAATNLLRASGKVMSETTDMARTRLNEAINSVSSHDNAIRAFLGDTAEKTDRITSLLEDVSRSAVHASETMGTFDARMAQFEEKSNAAFTRIDESGDAISNASVNLSDAHAMMNGSLTSMNEHTEMLARILTAVRDEYSSFSTEWKQNLAETAPVFTQLKTSSETLQTQLRDEWSVYAQQSRQLLTALEQDVRAMNTRTEQVTLDTEKLIGNLAMQTQRVADNANHFDLQVANISLRLEDATSSVLSSNREVVETTNSQIETIHTSVQDMAQRLGILSQLTGTLGAVAGQLGQIVPTLGDAQRLRGNASSFAFANPAQSNDPALLARFEEISGGFSSTVDNIKSEFDGVRGQIGRWVEMLTGGYKNLAEQINEIDGRIDTKINALNEQLQKAPAAAPSINLGEELVPAMRLIHEGLEKGYAVDATITADLQLLKNNLHTMASAVGTTAQSLQNIATLVEQGFESVGGQLDAYENEPVSVSVDTSRIETAAGALEALLNTLQGHSADVVGRLGTITQRLEGTSEKLQHVSPSAEALPAIEQTEQRIAPSLPPLEFSEKANLDQLQHQIENISAMLDQFSADGSRFINPQGQAEELTPDKSKAFVETVMATIIRLHHIAESIEKIGGTTPPNDGQDSKTG